MSESDLFCCLTQGYQYIKTNQSLLNTHTVRHKNMHTHAHTQHTHLAMKCRNSNTPHSAIHCAPSGTRATATLRHTHAHTFRHKNMHIHTQHTHLAMKCRNSITQHSAIHRAPSGTRATATLRHTHIHSDTKTCTHTAHTHTHTPGHEVQELQHPTLCHPPRSVRHARHSQCQLQRA